MTSPLDDDMTELVDAQIDRVDLVGSPANGRPFVLMKAAADDGLTQPLIPADMVADLIAKADSQETPTVTDPAPADVVKADTDVTELLATDADTAPGSEDQPGSPAWEAVDAATAQKWAGILSRAKAALTLLSDREAAEAAVGDDGDASNAWDLDDAACAIDYAISLLAPYALGEQMEVELAQPSVLEAVGKAAAALDGAPLGVVEGLAPIVKAGRVLSSANEQAIRTAVDSLAGVLNSLPQAPAADDVTKETAVASVPKSITIDVQPRLVAADGEPIAKGADLLTELLKGAPELTQADAFAALVSGGKALAKAAGDPQLAVFDADGKLIGTIDPGKLSPIATSPAAAEPAADASAEGTDGGSADDPANGDDPSGNDVTPGVPPAASAPAADAATIPGTATVQSPPAHDPTVAKATAVTALEEVLAPLVEELRKHAELANVVKGLEERVEKMGKLPDNRRSPVLNGATGTPGAVTRDSSEDGDAFAPLQKAVDEAKTPAERGEAQQRLAFEMTRARFQQR